jgi:hypothetical protein
MIENLTKPSSFFPGAPATRQRSQLDWPVTGIRDRQKLMQSRILGNPEAKPLDCGSAAAAFSGNTNNNRRQLRCRTPRRPCGRFYFPTPFISHRLFNPALPVALQIYYF